MPSLATALLGRHDASGVASVIAAWGASLHQCRTRQSPVAALFAEHIVSSLPTELRRIIATYKHRTPKCLGLGAVDHEARQLAQRMVTSLFGANAVVPAVSDKPAARKAVQALADSMHLAVDYLAPLGIDVERHRGRIAASHLAALRWYVHDESIEEQLASLPERNEGATSRAAVGAASVRVQDIPSILAGLGIGGTESAAASAHPANDARLELLCDPGSRTEGCLVGVARPFWFPHREIQPHHFAASRKDFELSGRKSFAAHESDKHKPGKQGSLVAPAGGMLSSYSNRDLLPSLLHASLGLARPVHATHLPADYARLDDEEAADQTVMLRLFEDLARALNGGRLTSCKSSKDRTGMAITLEESRLLSQFEAAAVTSLSSVIETATAGLLGAQQHSEGSTSVGSLDPAAATGALWTAGIMSLQSPHDCIVSLADVIRATVTTAAPTSLQPVAGKAHAATAPAIHDARHHAASGLAGNPAPAGAAAAFAANSLAASWPSGALSQFLSFRLHSAYEHLAELTMPSADAEHDPAFRASFFGDMVFMASPVRSNKLVALQQSCRRFLCNDILPSITAHASGDADGDAAGSNVAAMHIVRSPISVHLSASSVVVSAQPLKMANIMREKGSRLANAQKNTGVEKFAFNTLQRSLFPVEYQCPVAVMGKAET